MELALYGVRMVAIAPGYTDIGWPADSHLRQAEKRLPLKRFAAPEEIAKGVAFLASPDATYMTGCVLTMDGRRNAAGGGRQRLCLIRVRGTRAAGIRWAGYDSTPRSCG